MIDDNEDNLISITELLKDYMPGCKTITALSGAKGIETAKKEKPDTILLDIIMPKMDGYEVCKRLKEEELTRHIPIIFLTAIKTSTKDMIKGLERGAEAYLTKPVEPGELVAQINVMLRIKKAEDELRAEKDLLEEKVVERTTDLVKANTELTMSKEEIRKSEEKFSSLVNNSPDIIMRIVADGVVTYINYDYSNQKPEDIIGRKIYELIPSEFHDIAKKTIQKVFKTGESFSFENLSIDHTDKVLWYRNNIAAIRINGKVTAATIIATDISSMKQTEILQNEFVASVSHELRTPLTLIRESLSMLSEGLLGDLNSDQLDLVNPCIEDVDRLVRILNNLLSISMIEGKKIELVLEMVDIVKLAKGVVSSFERQAESNNINLVFTPKRESINLYLDRDRIIQVFMNLIGNALKFTQEGKIEIVIVEKKDVVECCIVDTGIGIEQNELGTLFDRFHQVGKIMRAGKKGSGLGLSISKGIVKLHKGRIWVNTAINKGSKFCFSLPRYDAEKIIVDQIEINITKAAKKRTRLSLLLIKLNNYSIIESKFGAYKADKITNLILQIIKDKLAPGEFSLIRGKDEVILFSDIPKQNINVFTSKLEDIISESVKKIIKDIKVSLSYGCSIYPDNGGSADELIQDAFRTLLKNDKD